MFVIYIYIYIYITMDMLYTLHDELYGGARRMDPKASAAKEKAEKAKKLKKQIRENDAEFLDEYMDLA